MFTNNQEVIDIHYLQQIVNHLDMAIWSADPLSQKVTFFSKAIRDLYEVEAEDIHFNTWKNFIHPDDLKDVLKRQDVLEQGNKLTHTYRIITASGNLKWVKDQTVPLLDKDGRLAALLGAITDITETHTLHEKLERMSYYNETTQLPNRFYSRKELSQWLSNYSGNGSHFGLMALDLDGFKRINDTFGQELADDVLKEFARKLTHIVGEDGIVFHLSGDEFLILLNPKERRSCYHEMAQHLINKIETPLLVQDYEFYLTASIGLSLFPEDGADELTLVKNANIALSLAKELGKNNYQTYSPRMNIEMVRLFQFESDLRKAIEKNELYLEYQPRIDAETKRVNGAEALIRWKHPKLGIVSPGEFIPLAEKTGIIKPISDFVIQTVCMQINQWRKVKLPLHYISINVSPMNFFRNDFIEQFACQLKKYDIPAHMIEIEITEGVLLYPSEAVENQIKSLREMGSPIALDDYGTGHSSIHYLKKYPFNTIKIDRVFIRNITDSNEDAVIVKSIIDMAKGLKKIVVAEGVETLEQYLLLKKYGCDEIQGYHFSRPVAAMKIEQYINDVSNKNNNI